MRTPSPFPDWRDLYLLVAGVVLGVLLSGAVLGNLSPRTYDRFFVGGHEIRQHIDQRQNESERDIARLEATGVTDVHITEQREQREQELAVLRAAWRDAHREHLIWLGGRMTALVIAMGVVMVVEVLVSPQPGPGRRVEVPAALSRLITARYALLALWLALVIAQPAVLAELTTLLFAALVVAVALLAALTPLGRHTPRAT